MLKTPIRLLLVVAALVILSILILQPISVFYFKGNIDVLFPKGIVALKERNLLFILQGIMFIVVIPVYILTFIFSWKYRASNKNAVYDPDFVDNHVAEYFWWGIPCVITLVMAVITWQYTHELDPYKALKSENKALTIQVIALDWKWLFIYPEERIATVNFIQFPKERPIHFEITADAPMNSFWIPRLGGQIYAMAKMKTQLNLMASEIGDFKGSSANISGEGFSGMTFIARASSEEDYEKWLKTAQGSTKQLDLVEYNKIALPSQKNPVVLYQLKDEDLFNKIMNKYMHPQGK